MLVRRGIQCETFVHYAVKRTDDRFCSETSRSWSYLKMFKHRNLGPNPHAEIVLLRTYADHINRQFVNKNRHLEYAHALCIYIIIQPTQDKQQNLKHLRGKK